MSKWRDLFGRNRFQLQPYKKWPTDLKTEGPIPPSPNRPTLRAMIWFQDVVIVGLTAPISQSVKSVGGLNLSWKARRREFLKTTICERARLLMAGQVDYEKQQCVWRNMKLSQGLHLSVRFLPGNQFSERKWSERLGLEDVGEGAIYNQTLKILGIKSGSIRKRLILCVKISARPPRPQSEIEQKNIAL